MRKLISIGAVLGVLALPATAAATHSPGSSGPRDFVTGGGHHSLPDTQFTLSAHSGPLGENPKGHLSFKTDGGERFKADVTCVIVAGNQAFVTGVFTRPGSAEGQLVVAHAVDNGEPGDATPDLLRFSFAGAIFPVQNRPGCFLPFLPPVPVTQGNITVHDATP
jgi:hypothetical protein